MEKQKKLILNFIRSFFQKAHRQTAILGLSAGLDSSVTCLLCSQALGPKNIHPLFLPYPPCHSALPSVVLHCRTEEGHSNLSLCHSGLDPESIQIRNQIKNLLSLCQIPPKNFLIEDLSPQINAFLKNHRQIDKVSLGNKISRERMSQLYYYSRQLNGLVVGTSNLSEILLGYFTLHGDGAWDLAPLAHLYKTEVRKLAVFLKIPPEIIGQPPTAGLWSGQTDAKELGFSYEIADQVLQAYFSKSKKPFYNRHSEFISESLPKTIPIETVQKVLFRVQANRFKLSGFPYSSTLLKPLSLSFRPSLSALGGSRNL